MTLIFEEYKYVFMALSILSQICRSSSWINWNSTPPKQRVSQQKMENCRNCPTNSTRQLYRSVLCLGHHFNCSCNHYECILRLKLCGCPQFHLSKSPPLSSVEKKKKKGGGVSSVKYFLAVFNLLTTMLR